MTQRTTLQAAGRRGAILAYLRGGERSSDEVAAMWREKALRNHAWRYVVVDTIQRDLNAMVRQGLLVRFRRTEQAHPAPWRSRSTNVTYGLVAQPVVVPGCDRPCPHCSIAAPGTRCW